MQTLIFNTTKKTVQLFSDSRVSGIVLETFDNVPTVKIETEYYEVIQTTDTGKVPVLRVPISNTNMLIER
jgi:hypothetical protein